jgi:hypothetical protein
MGIHPAGNNAIKHKSVSHLNHSFQESGFGDFEEL